jgi:16S rRNA (guanine1207-N2)-methyltransferase
MLIQAAAARLVEGGALFVHGHNDEGIKSAGKPCKEVFEQVTSIDSRKHCRLWRCTEVFGQPQGDIEAWQSTVEIATATGVMQWQNWPGLFAHGRLDRGTALLLQHLPTLAPDTRVLDFACGAGVIAQSLVRRSPGLRPDLLDVDALAVHAARQNVPEAGDIWLSDGWAAVPHRKWRCIVSNPPLHGSGATRDHSALWDLLDSAGKRLTPAGEMWLVTQRNVQLKAPLIERFNKVEVVARDQGFCVWRASRPR